MSRSRFTTTYQGRRVGPSDLVAMLEEHLDRGRPTLEQADDIRMIAKELARLAVPLTGGRELISRLKTISASRTALCWEELEDELHRLIADVVRRYARTTVRRRVATSIRAKLTPGLVAAAASNEKPSNVIAKLSQYRPSS